MVTGVHLDVACLRRLLLHGANNVGMAVARVGDADAARKVEVALALVVEEIAAW